MAAAHPLRAAMADPVAPAIPPGYPVAVQGASAPYLVGGGDRLPLEDQALAALFQATVVGVTGLPGELVRRRWYIQDSPITPPPRLPSNLADWAAIGKTRSTPDAGPWIRANPYDAGTVVMWRHEVLEILASFYGPNKDVYAGLFRDGMALPQNLETLKANQIGLVELGEAVQVNEKVNNQWYQRLDIQLQFNRKVERTFGVGRFQNANIHIDNGEGTTRDVATPVVVPVVLAPKNS